MRRRRARGTARRRDAFAAADLCRGPGNLTRALGITLRDNRLDLTRGALRIEDRGLPRARRGRGAGASASTSASSSEWRVLCGRQRGGVGRPGAGRRRRAGDRRIAVRRGQRLASPSRRRGRPVACAIGNLAPTSWRPSRRTPSVTVLPIGASDSSRMNCDASSIVVPLKLTMMSPGAGRRRRRRSARTIRTTSTPRAFGAPSSLRRSAASSAGAGCRGWCRAGPRRT